MERPTVERGVRVGDQRLVHAARHIVRWDTDEVFNDNVYTYSRHCQLELDGSLQGTACSDLVFYTKRC